MSSEMMSTSWPPWVSSIGTFCGLIGSLGFVFFLLYHRRLIYIVFKTLPRDVRGAIRFSTVTRKCQYWLSRDYTVGQLFDENVAKNPNKVCFYFENECWTFKQVQDMSNQVANYFARQGYKKGQTICLLMESRPEFVIIWLGLSRIGVIASFINFNLRQQPLKHTFDCVNTTGIIFGHELTDSIQELMDMGQLPSVPLYCSGHGGQPIIENSVDLDAAIKNSSIAKPFEVEKVKTTDTLFFIYTSGTTGLPKAAPIKHFRYMMAANGIHYMNQVNHKDIVYDALPLYHMTGAMVGISMALVIGASVVIRKKFSASNFWKDCIQYNVTVGQYLGETCRYLLAQKPSPEDRQHKVRIMVGNGLRHEIWEEFTTRFNISKIGEVYGSTEGNCNISNINSHVGAVGFVPRLLYRLLPMRLIKIDHLTGEPIRDPNTGIIVQCGPNEPGECVGKIIKEHPIRDFNGYTDAVSTKKKILKDVFAKGDMAFRTGDMLMMDEYGYFYFKDRTGDTFRWKGENVSTTEVEGIILNIIGFKDAVVYGVEISGNEGRAGMCAIADPDESVDLDLLAEGLHKSLPSYARPLFLRVSRQIDLTSTYKMKKMGLQREGFDISTIKDKMYFLSEKSYVPLDNTLYNKIIKGEIRL